MKDTASSDNAQPSQEMLLSMVQAITEGQAKENALRCQELELRSEEIALNERIAMKSIEAQERFHSEGRLQYNRHLFHRYVYTILTVVVICAFIFMMVLYGGKDIIIEMLKIALAAGTGAYGGYYAGKSKKSDADES